MQHEVTRNDLVELFYRELLLCGVQPSQRVTIIHDLATFAGYPEAMEQAAERAGALGHRIALPIGRRYPIAGLPEGGHMAESILSQPEALSQLQGEGLVVDMTWEGLVHSQVRSAILRSGGRMIWVREPADILQRMFPRPALRARCERALDLVRAGHRLRVTSAAGTELEVRLSQEMPALAQYGYTDTQGRWDHFAGGFVAFYPEEVSISGRVVLDVGDILLPPNVYVDQPIRVEIRQGWIEGIYGGGVIGEWMRQYLASWKDRNAYAVSHVGWGLDETARWEALAFYDRSAIVGQDCRAFAGNFMWSTGPNVHRGRLTPAHLDIPMRGCTVELDGQTLIQDGRLVHPDLRVEGGAM